jgi:hypothetical protein
MVEVAEYDGRHLVEGASVENGRAGKELKAWW